MLLLRRSPDATAHLLFVDRILTAHQSKNCRSPLRDPLRNSGRKVVGKDVKGRPDDLGDPRAKRQGGTMRTNSKYAVSRHESLRAIIITVLSAAFLAAVFMTNPNIEPVALAATSTETGAIFASGSGTAEDPYSIENKAQLQAFRDSVNSGNAYEGSFVKLDGDIDISGDQWTPIGASTRASSGVTSSSTPFKGTFDGSGRTISGLTITPSTSSSGTGDAGGTGTTPALEADYALGLFGAVMGGTVTGLNLVNINIDAPNSELAGGAIGLLSEGGTVSNIRTSGSIKAKCGTGGIVGRMTANGSISNCTNEATVEVTGGSGNCGGIVGAAYYTPEGSHMAIDGCVNKATITGVNDTGGIAGLCCAFVSGCTNEGAVNGSGYAVGGIAGEMKNYGSVTHCTNKGVVANASDASPYGTGGIVGWVRYDSTASAYPLSEPVVVADNTNTADVNAATGIGVGGIVGVLYSAGTVTGNENQAQTLSGKQFVAGIVGNLQDQGASSLPSSIKEGATIENNVSTTPASSISGTLKALYAYNNSPSIFTVKDNSGAWEAIDSSTGDMRYATLERAMANASAGDTVTLTSDVDDAGMLEAQAGHDVTLELNGHDIEFGPTGGITANGDSVTVEGEGDIYAVDGSGAIEPSPKLFTEVVGSNGRPGRIILKGGTYPVDVAGYVAPGYESDALEEPNAHDNRFEVVPAADKEDPDRPTGPSGDGSQVLPGEGDAGSAAGGTKGEPKQATPIEPANIAVNGDTTAKTDDPAAWGLLLIGGIAMLAGGAMVVALVHLRRRS